MLNFTVASANLRENLPVFRMLFDAIQIGISITNAKGEIVYANDALAKIDNVAKSDIVDKTMCEVYEFTEETSPVMQVLRTGEAIVDKVNSYRTRSGNLVNASCTIYPLSTGGKQLCGAICYTQDYSLLHLHFQNVQHSIVESADNPADSSVHYTFDSFVGGNAHMSKALKKAGLAARSASSVMLVGETGVGKELFAQSIHAAGSRRQAPYTALNCSAIPETLLEGILFGTTRGAFTGAVNKAGLFEVSHGGTLFLDEVDSMPVGLQSKLLRVLQENRVRRVGEATERAVDVRVISAVGRNPDELVREKLLRPDFYYRLGVVKIYIPSLRERMDDLEVLARHFLDLASRKLFRPVPRLSDEALRCLHRHVWPGNVRELAHVMEAVVNILDQQMEIQMEHLVDACPEFAAMEENKAKVPTAVSTILPESSETKTVSSASISNEQPSSLQNTLTVAAREAEVGVICDALKTAAGKQVLAAKLLGISPQLLRHKIKKHGIAVAEFVPERLSRY